MPMPVAVLTEWMNLKGYDWKRVFESMKKPAHIFDGRAILDVNELRNWVYYLLCRKVK
jgi:UDPglucose 6-dehydrogenase